MRERFLRKKKEKIADNIFRSLSDVIIYFDFDFELLSSLLDFELLSSLLPSAKKMVIDFSVFYSAKINQ